MSRYLTRGRHRAAEPAPCCCGKRRCRRHSPKLKGLAAALPLLLFAAGLLTTLNSSASSVDIEARPALPTLPPPNGTQSPDSTLTLPDPAVPPTAAATPPPPATATSIPARVRQQEIAAEAVAEHLEEARTDLQAMSNEHTAAADQLGEAARALVTARTDVDNWTRNSYIDAARRPAGLATDPRNRMFGQHAPAAGTPLANLRAAEAAHRAATDELTRAATAALQQQQRVLDLATDLDQRGKALQQLRKAHQPTLVAARRQQEVTDAASAARYLRDADGRAGKGAVKAVEFALAQRGKPYEWGAEGPDRYDCSGLVQTAYARAGIRLPRTARPQYRATPRVPITSLLPGDLLFFATDKSDWNTIHHVAIYLGQGRMLHAPTTGDVVRIAPVWWAEFYAATRVVPAASAPATTPRATPPATPKATPPRTPTPTPTRTPSATPVPTTTPTPTPTPSATSPATTTPPPTAAPPPSPTPTSAAPDPTPSTTPPPVLPTTQPSATP